MFDWVLNMPMQTDTLVNMWKENMGSLQSINQSINQLNVMKYESMEYKMQLCARSRFRANNV